MNRTLEADICAAGARVAAAALSPGTTGNISSRESDRVVCTPSGASLAVLAPTGLSELDMSGRLVAGPTPTKEVPLHLSAYASSPRVRAVVHLHSPYATAVSCLADLDKTDAVPAYTPYLSMRAGRVGVIDYVRPGDPQLGSEARIMLDLGYTCLLLANHGCVVVATSLDAALATVFELEAATQLQLLLAGRNAHLIPEQERSRLLP